MPDIYVALSVVFFFSTFMQAVVEEGAMVVESDEEIIITMVGHRDQIGIIMVVIDHNHTEGLCVENVSLELFVVIVT